MRVLFYGSLNPAAPEYEELCRFVRQLVEHLMDCGAVITTREGNNIDSKSIDKDKVDIVPVDNVVLDSACDYRIRESMPYDKIISFAESKEFEQGNRSGHDRKIIMLPVPHRLAMYREMLENTDVLVTVGGKEGVYRLGLFGYALQKPVIPIGFSGGTSRVLWKELAAAGGIPIEDSSVRESIGATNIPRKSEVKKLAEAICQTGQHYIDKQKIDTLNIKHNSIRSRASLPMSLANKLALATLVITLITTIIGATWTIAVQFEQSRVAKNNHSSQTKDAASLPSSKAQK